MKALADATTTELDADAPAHYQLALYIAGTTNKSMRAITNLRQFCERFLAGRYHLSIIDIYQCPDATRAAQIVAAPTLVRSFPLPIIRLVGEIADMRRILVDADLAHRVPPGDTR
jgi:circadian clock protein KaiB